MRHQAFKSGNQCVHCGVEISTYKSVYCRYYADKGMFPVKGVPDEFIHTLANMRVEAKTQPKITIHINNPAPRLKQLIWGADDTKLNLF